MKRILITLIGVILLLSSSAQELDLQALLKRIESEKDTVKANSLLDIITIYGNRGLFDSADYYALQMLTVSEKSSYSKGLSMAYNALGISKMVRSNYEEALANYFKGLRFAEAIGYERNIITITMNIATVYTYQEDYLKAIPLLHKVLAFSLKRQNWIKSSGVATDIGYCYSGAGNTDSAKYFYSKGIELLNKIDRNSLKGPQINEYILLKSTSIPKTADFYLKNGNAPLALKISLELWTEISETENSYAKISCLNSLAKCYLKLNQPDSSIFYSNAGIKIMPGNEFADETKEFYNCKAESYSLLGNYKEAFENKQIYQQLNDSIYNKEKFKAIKDIQTKYETEKQVQKIAALNKEKRNQRLLMILSLAAFFIALFALFFILRSKKLQKKVFENEKLLQKIEVEKKIAELEQTALRAQMNPHFIFNSLNSVQRYVIQNDIEGVNTYLTTFASLIRQTLGNSGKKFIPLKDEIKYLEVYLKLEQMRSNAAFSYNIQIDSQIDTGGLLVPNMILQPFIENSINHAFVNKKRGEGKIELRFEKSQKLVCKIIDNGSGIKPKNIGPDDISSEKYESMGSTITQKRIAAYNSMEDEKIEIETGNAATGPDTDCGTCITIKFPLKNTY